MHREIRITAQDLIDKRRKRWEERHDLDYDRKIVEAAAQKISEDRELAREIHDKPYLLIEIAFVIVDKKKATVPFFLNDVQRDFIARFEECGTGKPYFVLKGRQQGFTSLITAMQLCFAIVRKNFSGMTLADRSDNTLAIFHDKARVVLERLPQSLQPRKRFASKKELFFDVLNSSWRAETASDDIGRSRTLNFVHFSEVAFYDCTLSDLQKGIGEAMTADAFCVYETTANGFNEAKALWDSGACHNLFYEWWRTSEYRERDHSHIALAESDEWLSERVELLREQGLDEDQISWYCRKYAAYLDKDSIRQEYPCTPDEAFISTGTSIFDTSKVTRQLMRVDGVAPLRRGTFKYDKIPITVKYPDGTTDVEWQIRNATFEERKDGIITIHEEPMVKRGRAGEITARAPYAIGGDTSGLGTDYFTGKVICNLDGHTVATLRVQRIDEDLYSEQMYCLGKYYNDAIIGIEINYSRQPMRVLQRVYKYPNLYYRERVDGLSDTVERVCGFETTSKTRPIILEELVRLMREHPEYEVDPDTLREMLTFVKKPNGKKEAVDGMHDDLVMALAIAHHVSMQGEHKWIEVLPPEDHFLEEQFNYQPQASGNESYMSWEDL